MLLPKQSNIVSCMFLLYCLCILCAILPNVFAQSIAGGLVGKAIIPDHANTDNLAKPKKHFKNVMKLSETQECGDEVQRFCSDKMKSNNFLILDCLQNDEETVSKLSDECHHFLWKYKYNLTRSDTFDKTSNRDCSAELAKLPECKDFQPGEGKRIPCLIENFDTVESKTCKNFLSKMAAIVFSDYHFMEFFIKDCLSDISALKCGRLPQDEEDDSVHLQGSVISCLNKDRKKLAPKCKKTLLRVAELQSDDFHLDRPLYYACKDDRENFCSDVVAGDGAIFQCLYKQLGNPKLSEDCRVRLEARQELVAEDVKVDKMFYGACKADIKKHHCASPTDDFNNEDVETDLGRSRILLCLENAHNNVSAPGKKVHAECLQQMFALRSELMSDYKISPELVSACEKEIDQFCDGLEEGGNTIQCLMENAADKKNKRTFGHQCSAQVGNLLHVADPFEDITLDRPLQRACGDVVKSACKRLPRGEGNVVNCLLENLDHEDMTNDCEDRLLEIQYFAVRDFKLDYHLYKACQTDAAKLCHTKDFENPKMMVPENGPLTFACLHRHLSSEDSNEQQLSRQCLHEVRRVMKERTDRISLMPEVETACMKELSEFCSDDDEHMEKGGEMVCLQSNLDDLSDECKEYVGKFTEEQSEYIELDRILMKACTPMMKQFCKDFMDKTAMATNVLECLFEHKNHVDMDEKCASGIEHHQLTSMKDFRFTHKFREACQESVSELCKTKKTKYDVVTCLSEHVRNDTLFEKEHRVQRQCRKQLRSELLQRSENIKLDHDLQKKCDLDVKKFCRGVEPGNAEVTECLKKHQEKLTSDCHKLLFKREEIAAVVGDYALLHTCKKMIKNVCRLDMSEPEIFDCLKEHKNDMDFDESCRKIVLKREIEQSQDFRLNPHVQKACRHDIPKFCSHIYVQGLPETELEGKVINCLKKKFISKTKSLSKNCELEIKSMVKEAALDINQNPVLMKLCKVQIKKFCVNEIRNVDFMKVEDGPVETSGEGAVIECLKKNFRDLGDTECKKEVAYMIEESRVDINVDPLLHSTCQRDLIDLCVQIPQGQGRQMACLLSHLETDPDALTQGCRGMLDRRKSLWEYAAQVAPLESFGEMYDQVKLSPSRNYFMAVIFTVVGVIFIVGITCGRVTKRVRAEMKNR